MGVVIGMGHYLMAGIMQGLNGFGIFIHPLPYHKKCCFDIIFAKNVYKLLSILVPPCRIKGKRNTFIVPCHRINGKLSVGF